MTIFDTSVSGLPGAFFTGDGALAGEKVLVHTNSAGGLRKFPRCLYGQNVHFSVSSAVPVGRMHMIDRINDRKKWQLALDQSGNNCADAWVIKATEIIPLQDYPPGTILFLRAEPLNRARTQHCWISTGTGSPRS
jgi:hypothetical protein